MKGRSVLALLAVLVVLAAALPALANVSVSTSDGVTLTLTNTGAFSSLTVNGNTAPTLAGVNGGFFIIPMDGVAAPNRQPGGQTYLAGTQITGTATQNGSNVTLTGTAQNQTFSITLTGGLPYLKVDGGITGNGSDHAFLIDFRLPIDANGWTWCNAVANGVYDSSRSINDYQTIDTSSSTWYFAYDLFYMSKHPALSKNPYGTITRNGSGSGSADMGISLAPLFYPPQAFLIEYYKQTGLFIEFELGTTPKTTRHPNTADFHFVLYQHNPKWGNRSAVQRFQGFFPSWFERTVSGGNWFVDIAHDTNSGDYPTTPEDWRMKFGETVAWDDSFTQSHSILTMRYEEPWSWHEFTEDPSLMEGEAIDTPANWVINDPPCHCPGNRGMANAVCAQASLNSVMQNPDGSYIGPDDPSTWSDGNGSSWRWIMDPDPDQTNWRTDLTPGTTRNSNAMFHEWYDNWGNAPSTPGNIFTGLYHDSAVGYWTGWVVAHDFASNHWSTYDYNPGIYWGSFGNGLVCMWAPMSNVKFEKAAHEQMRKEGRPVMANMGGGFGNAMEAPFLDMWGNETQIESETIADQAIMRTIAGPKPLSFLYSVSNGDHPVTTTADMLSVLPFGIYPGAGKPNNSSSDYGSGPRAIYQQFMPIFDTLDAAGWNPITAATAADTTQILERFGPDSSGAIYFVLRAVKRRHWHGDGHQLRSRLVEQPERHRHFPLWDRARHLLQWKREPGVELRLHFRSRRPGGEDRLQRHAHRPGSELLRLAYERQRPAERDFHRQLHPLPDRVVLGLRRWEHLALPESQPHLQRERQVHRVLDGGQRLRADQPAQG